MPLRTLTLDELMSAVAAKTPAPGGGAAGPVVAALGAALGRMVVNYSIGKKRLAEHDGLHRESIAALERLGDEAIALADDDVRAYERLNAIQRLDAGGERRPGELADAVRGAIDVPRRALDLCETLASMLSGLDGTTNHYLRSDLVLAAVLTEAAARASEVNVRINLPLLEDEVEAEEIGEDARMKVDAIRQAVAQIEVGG